MAIKRKKAGAVPIYPERWKELAKDKDRLVEAAREYMLAHQPEPGKLNTAYRAVREFHVQHTQRFGDKR